LWALHELNLKFNLVRINPFESDYVDPQILKLNPDGKVPILVHEGKVLLESLAIMEYLNSIAKGGGLVPYEKESNYVFRRRLHYGLTEIEPYLWLAEQSKGPLRKYYSWPQGVYEESINRVRESSKVVETYVAPSGYMLETGFSIADIYYYHILTWAKQHEIGHAPKVEFYLEQLEKRKAFPKQMHWANTET
jgi:glutathione S-transferase